MKVEQENDAGDSTMLECRSLRGKGSAHDKRVWSLPERIYFSKKQTKRTQQVLVAGKSVCEFYLSR